MDKRIETMTAEELRGELTRLKDGLCDLEEMHAFTFGRTSVHISAETAQTMQEEHEQECRRNRERIAEIEALLRARGRAEDDRRSQKLRNS